MSPAYGGWGGRYVWRQPRGEPRPFWTQGGDAYPGRDNSRDTVTVEGRPYTSDQATIWRWRRAFQNDFAARMDWTIQEKGAANHNPEVVVNGQPGTAPLVIDAEVGTSVTLDAAGTRDPDGNALSLDWSFYPEAGSGIPGQPLVVPRPRPAVPPGAAAGAGGIPSAPAGGPPEAPARVVVENPRSSRAVVVPKVAGIAHVVLAVEDDGTPNLTSYRRVILNIKPAAPRVALTFDDLPVHSSLPPGLSRSDVARSLIEALRAHRAPPTYGFVNARGLDGSTDTADVLRLWRAAGHPLANHTYSHMDLHANTPEAFGQDVLANEETLREHMGDADDWHWFRYPYLREGETLEKRRAVATFLKDQGYRVAQVTLNFDDYAYNEPWARCVAKNDAEAIDGLKRSYLRRAAASIDAGQEAAQLVYGRGIAHVMLLHIGGFQTVMLPQLLELLERRGFRLVTLGEAQSDPVYAVDPDQALPGGATLLDRMRAAKAIPATATPDDTFARIAEVCRNP
jgi:peptidoglycan/xylan/chitin deacetylase (PgdA/CDA1 family)